MMIDASVYTGFFGLFWLLLLIYSVFVIMNRNNFGQQLQQRLLCRGLSKQSKVSTNTLLQLLRVAPTFFANEEITPSSIQARNHQIVRWLMSYTAAEFKLKVFEFNNSGKKHSALRFVLCIEQYTTEVQDRFDELVHAVEAEVFRSPDSMTLVFPNQGVVLEELPNIIDRLGGLEASGEIYNNTTQRVKKQIWRLNLWRMVKALILVKLCLSLAPLILHGVQTQSISVFDNGVFKSFFAEYSPWLYVLLIAVLTLIFLLLCTHLILCNDWKRHLSTSQLFARGVMVALALIAFNYALMPQRENLLPITEQRLVMAAETELKQIYEDPPLAVEPIKIPLIAPKLLAALKANDFTRVNSELDRYHQLAEQAISNELLLDNAYQSFAVPDDAVRSAIFKWQTREPDNKHAKLAQAYYLFAQAWHVRGGGYGYQLSDDTKRQTQQLMARSYERVTDLLSSKQHTAIAGALGIRILQVVGSRQQLQQLYGQLMAAEPASYVVRYRYLMSLRPKWKGNYLSMQRVIDDMQPYFESNRQLKSLRSAVLVEAGDIEYYAKNYFKAIGYYQAAQRFGSRDYILVQLGKSEYRLQNYTSALAYLNRAIELDANGHRAYYWRSKTLRRLNQMQQALDDQQIAMSINGYEENYQTHLKRIRKALELKKYRNYYGFDAQGQVLSTPDNKLSKGNPAYQQALTLIKSRQYDEAAIKLIEAINRDPHVIDYYLALDMVLAQKQQWSTIITFWQQYLELYPLSPRAHREISGTYYHNRDREKFIVHLRKAAELGDKEAIRLISRSR